MALPEEVVHNGKRLKRQDTPYGPVYRDPETGRVYLPEELGLKEEGEEPVIEIGEPEKPVEIEAPRKRERAPRREARGKVEAAPSVELPPELQPARLLYAYLTPEERRELEELEKVLREEGVAPEVREAARSRLRELLEAGWQTFENVELEPLRREIEQYRPTLRLAPREARERFSQLEKQAAEIEKQLKAAVKEGRWTDVEKLLTDYKATLALASRVGKAAAAVAVAGEAARVGRGIVEEMRGAFYARGVHWGAALQRLAYATGYVALAIMLGLADKYVYGFFSRFFIWDILATIGSMMASVIHFVVLLSMTLLASALLLTLVRVWRGRGLRRGWTANIVEALAFTVMAAFTAWLCRRAWIAVVLGMGAGALSQLLTILIPKLFVNLFSLAWGFTLFSLGFGIIFLLAFILFVLLPLTVYLFLILPAMLTAQIMLLGAVTKEIRKSMDLGLVIMLGLFALLRAVAPGLAAAGVVAAILLAAILVISTGDYGWLRLAIAAIAVWWAPLGWGLEDFLDPVYRAYVEIVGTPGAQLGYTMMRALFAFAP